MSWLLFSNNTLIQVVSHYPDFFLQFLYSPVVILASTGFSASSGIAQARPNRLIPSIRPSRHNTCILRSEISHFSAACLIVKYSNLISFALIKQKKHRCDSRCSVLSIASGNHVKGPIVLRHYLSIVLPLIHLF